MTGRATAPVQPTGRRLVQTVWGAADIDARQKWRAVWPAIAGLPEPRCESWTPAAATARGRSSSRGAARSGA